MDALRELPVWVWTTLLWWSGWNVFLVCTLVIGIFETTSKRKVHHYIGIGLIAVAFIVSLYHSWLSQHNEAVRRGAIIAEYERRISTAVTISQSWVWYEGGPNPVWWIICNGNASRLQFQIGTSGAIVNGGGMHYACFPQVVLLLRIRNIHSAPVGLEGIAAATMRYQGKSYNLGPDLHAHLFLGDPSTWLSLLQGDDFSAVRELAPNGQYVDGIVALEYPYKAWPVTSYPSSIHLIIRDTIGTDLPVTWTPRDSPRSDFYMFRVPDILPLGPRQHFKFYRKHIALLEQ